MMPHNKHALIDYGPGPTPATASGTFHVGIYGPDGTEMAVRSGDYRQVIAYAVRSGVDRHRVDLTPPAQRAVARMYAPDDAPARTA